MRITKSFTRNVVAAVAVGAMATAMMPASAFAAFAPDTKALSAEGYVTGASPRPPAPALDMLGVSDVECDPQGISAAIGELTWASPKYYIWGSSYYNTNPNPFITNAVINTQAGSVVATPTAVVGGNASVRTQTKPGGNPDAGLALYGTSDQVNALWNLKPDVIMGTNADTCIYTSEDYKAAFPTGFENYNPKSVRYDYSDISTIIKSVYSLADAADTVVKESNGTKKLRYNSTATAIAQNYEEYVHGLQGFILQQLEANKASKKTTAIITEYDEAAGTYKLMNATNTTNATTARYLEVTKNVSKNLGDTIETATKDDLAKADLIIIQQNVDNPKNVADSLGAATAKKVYYCTSTNLGAAYSVARNSTDNAQDMGRILGCLYPEYISQDDLVCYYFDAFYHIKTGKLGEFVDNAMDGVVNWDSTDSDRTQWTVADAKGYNAKVVQAKLDLGTAWIAKNAKTVDSSMALETKDSGKTYVSISASDYNKLAKAVLVKQTLKVSPAKKTVKSGKKASFKIKTSATGKISYSVSSKVKKAGVSVSKAGKVTVKKSTAKGTYKVTVKAAKTSLLKAATKTVTVKVK